MKKENKTCKQTKIDRPQGTVHIAQTIGSTDKFSTAILAYLLPSLCPRILHIALAMRPVCLLDRTKNLHQSDRLHFISDSNTKPPTGFLVTCRRS